MAFVKSLAFRLSYFLGFYPQRLRSPKELYDFLENRRTATKEDELRKVSAFIGIANKQKYYDALLKIYVPEWTVKIEKSEFIGEGYGESSLNAFRKVSIKGVPYFEKVYFNSRPELQTVTWFQIHIDALIKDKINPGKIEKTYQGEFLTIMYYRFLELAPLSQNNREESLVSLSKTLYELSLNKTLNFDTLDIPESIHDFRLHFQYQANRGSAKAKLADKKIDFDALENAVAKSKCVLTHGDIQETNVFENSTLIDWDSFGIFPLGLETAFLYYRLLFESKVGNDFSSWLKTHYKTTLLKEDWAIFERNFEYFLFVFSIELFKKEQYKPLQQQLTLSLTEKRKI